jgi:hypothetical protein
MGVFLLTCKKFNTLAAHLFPDTSLPFAGDVARMVAGAVGFLCTEEGQEPLFVIEFSTQVLWMSAVWLSLSSGFPALWKCPSTPTSH